MIKVVLADDSPFLRQVLKDALQNSNKIKIVGEAKNGKEAIELVKTLKPDILILDCEMPVMTGLEALRRIMDECPLPVFIFSSLASEGSSVTIKALEYGAVDFFLKPTGGAQKVQEIADDLVRKVEFIVLKSRFKNFKRTGSTLTASPSAAPRRAVTKPIALSRRPVDVIAMGSSTGGVQAAMKVVPRLPAHTKPIVWVQHMPPNFTKSFAERLNGLSKMTVKEAENGDKVEQGTCYLAPGGYQMRLKRMGMGWQIHIGETEKISGHCPSCDVLFDSVSELTSQNALGVILTGMGEDGKKGLLKMHDKGAYVVGQNESSCVVYGMPRAAFAAGAVDVECDIEDIAEAIVKLGGA
ncbi:MAG: chemotaxis response regulator protein-glutamate methylesterase [Candidatus Omnitrophica bacterium]|nr:chemotaxis response regulator protein-glutamate methylesterase [Candidatus Omnitrophota bacterium]